jgi:hypothetical protein
MGPEQDELIPDVECWPPLHISKDDAEDSGEPDFRRDDELRARSPFAHLFRPHPHPAVEGAPPIRLFTSHVFTIVPPINLSILSLVPLEDHAPVDLLLSFIFFLGCIFDFFLGDNLTVACGFAGSTFSWLSLAHPLTMWKGRKIGSMQLLTTGARLQYGVTLAIFLKIAVFGNELASHVVKLNRERAD